MSFHRKSIGLEVHVPHTFTYADAAARVAAVSTDFTDPDDLFKLARQTSDTTYWVLEQITPSVTWNQLGGAGGTPDLPFDAITDPAVDVAVTTAKIDLFSGTVVTLTAVGNSQTLQAPTDTTAGRKFFVLNNDTSNNTVPANGVTLSPAQYVEFRWDGDTWLLTAGGLAAGAGGLNQQIQYNDNGSLNGDPNHTWDNVNKKELIIGDLEQVSGTTALPYTPTIVSTIGVGLAARNSVVLGNYVFVVDNNSDDLRIFDVTDPSTPALISTLLVGPGRGVDIAGRYIFISATGGGGQLFIVDVIDKANPVVVGTVVVGGTPRGVRVSGNTAFVSANGSTISLISVDVSDVTNPVVLDTFAAGVNLRTEFDVMGEVAYVVSSSASPNFILVDISDPANMVAHVSLDIGSTVWAVRTVGRFAYVVLEQVDPNPSFMVFDISDPANTSNIPVGQLILNAGGTASPRALEVVGNFAYVVDALNNVLQVVDISDPTAPVLISTPTVIGQNPVSVSTVGRFAYITDNTDDLLQIVDIGGFDAQNINVGNVDTGALNVRRDIKAAGNLNANAGLFGSGGVYSDGDVVAGGFTLGAKGVEEIQIRKESDFIINGSVIELENAKEYVILQSFSTDKRFRMPESGGGFSPTVIRSTSKYGSIITSTGAGPDSLFFTITGQGQLVLKNVRFEDTGSRPFAVMTGLTQTSLLLELDDCDLVDFTAGSLFTTCVFNINNASFWTGSGTFELIDCECNIIDAFHANFSDTSLPALRVGSSSPSATTKSFLTVRNSRLSSQANESFFMLHSNLVVGSIVSLTDVQASSFTPGTGEFFATETGSISALLDSGGAPGVRTEVISTAHTVKDGDTIGQAGFTTETQMNGTFVASNITVNSYEIVAIFSGTDTGTWSNSSLDQSSPLVSSINNPGQEESKSIGSMYVSGNSTVTTISTINTFTDLDLGTALAASNIANWSLTNTTTGELTYNGVEPFSGTLTASVSASIIGGPQEFHFRAVKNGVVLPDAVETAVELKDGVASASLVVPISVVNNDTVRLQVENVDGTIDVTISHVSLSIQ